MGNARKRLAPIGIFWMGNPKEHLVVAKRFLDQKW
jgi:hypothetical protein